MNYELFQHPNKNIFLINMTRELDPYFSELVKRGIEKYLSQGKKIGILLNKKGFSGGTICPRCGHIPQCDHCSVAINYYHLPGGEKRGMCHICKKQYRYPSSCEACGSVEIKEYGLGTQKLAELLKTEFGAESLIVESESVKSPSKITKFYAQLQPLTKPGKAPVIIGTSLLTTPIKGWTFDLLIYLDADMGLNIPDYNANEKNFYFLYEGFVKHQTPVFLVQTLNPEQYSIRSACKMSESDFFLVENAFRKEHLYPPFGELCLILYKDEIEQKLFNKVDQLHKELLYLQQKYQLQDLEIYTTPPLIYKIFGKYRYQVVIKGKEVRNFMDIVYSKLQLHKKGFKINWMAETMV